MIAEFAWWILSDKDSFCIEIVRAKYRVRSTGHVTEICTRKIWCCNAIVNTFYRTW